MVNILLVCMGNVCRSPMAAGVLRRMLKETGLADKVRVESAGTHTYHEGAPPDPRSQETAARRGIDLSVVRARRLRIQDLDDFDYLLAMDRENYEYLLALCHQPEHWSKVQLLMDYAMDLPVREVRDPYYGGVEGFEQAMDLLEEASQGLVQYLRRQLSS